MNNIELNISVLYAEDKKDSRKNISEILSRRVKKIYVAKDGIEAFNLYKKHKPDLLLTDIQMPGMGGLELIEKIKQINPQIRIIITTAFNDSNYLLKSIDLQVDGYIIKPIRKSKLLSAINKQASIIILEKKNTEQEKALFISEERYRLLFDLLPFGGEIISSNGIIINCSKSTANMLGYSSSEIIGTHITKYLDKETIKSFDYSFPKLIKGEALSQEANLVHKNGKIINVLRLAQPLADSNGEINSVLALSIDITKRKHAEIAIKQQNSKLKIRNEELDAFSHTVAHDLKNPLGTMMGFAGLLYEDYANLTDDEFEKYISMIIKSGKKTQQIINNLLLFASVRKEDAKIDELDMKYAVNEAINHYQDRITKTEAIIKLPDNWPVVLGNAQWIEEVWVNYLSNALKYGGTPPIIEIGFDNEKITNKKGSAIRFWIRDNGKGISKENQGQLFKKFERLNKTNIKGHGLGLSIVKRIIKKLDGTVGVESTEGKGSLFYFTLPTIPKPEIQNLKPKINKLKILIVEDETTSDNYLRIVVKKLSRETLHAKTGKEAVEIFSKNPDIDLILMDIKMPIMDGYTATRQIRRNSKNVIIIAQTAYALSNDREEAIEAGCNDYISKPIDKGELLDMIYKLQG